jgi:hypothetical protein
MVAEVITRITDIFLLDLITDNLGTNTMLPDRDVNPRSVGEWIKGTGFAVARVVNI